MDHGQEVPAEASGSGPEVPEKPKRRSFDAAYKLRILEEAGKLTESGQLGEFVRAGGHIVPRLERQLPTTRFTPRRLSQNRKVHRHLLRRVEKGN